MSLINPRVPEQASAISSRRETGGRAEAGGYGGIATRAVYDFAVFRLTAFMPQIASNGTRPFDLDMESSVRHRLRLRLQLEDLILLFYDARLRCF